MRLLNKLTGMVAGNIIDQKLPENVKAALRDQANVDDLVIVMAEMTPIARHAADDSTDRSLTSAFNDVAFLLPAFREYLENGNLSPATGVKLAANQKKYESNGDVINRALVAGQDAVMMDVAQAIEQNSRLQDALNRIAVRTKGSFASLDQTADGRCFGVELATGKDMKIPLSKDNYRQIKTALYGP